MVEMLGVPTANIPNDQLSKEKTGLRKPIPKKKLIIMMTHRALARPISPPHPSFCPIIEQHKELYCAQKCMSVTVFW